MIVGIGIDAVEISRVERLLLGKGDRARKRLFTEAEWSYSLPKANPAQHLAARIAAKEAAFKALAGTEDARAIGWREIEVVRAADGRPSLLFHGRAADRAAELGVRKAWLSVTHSDAMASAVVVLES